MNSQLNAIDCTESRRRRENKGTKNQNSLTLLCYCEVHTNYSEVTQYCGNHWRSRYFIGSLESLEDTTEVMRFAVILLPE